MKWSRKGNSRGQSLFLPPVCTALYKSHEEAAAALIITTMETWNDRRTANRQLGDAECKCSFSLRMSVGN